MTRGVALLVPVLLLASAGTPRDRAEERSTRRGVDNVLVVTFDGLRWQEMFAGYDAALNDKADGGVSRPEPLRSRFDRPTPEARREALLPFIWTVVAREGQILGGPSRRSRVRITSPEFERGNAVGVLERSSADTVVLSGKRLNRQWITRVEVSIDGGRQWREASLDEPVLAKCHTRFRLPWEWKGHEAVLMSRATDETGYVQPTTAELLKVRGPNTQYHFNNIREWLVGADGAVRLKGGAACAPRRST